MKDRLSVITIITLIGYIICMIYGIYMIPSEIGILIILVASLVVTFIMISVDILNHRMVISIISNTIIMILIFLIVMLFLLFE